MDGLTNEGKKALYTELELALVDAEGGSLVNDDGVVIDAALDERLGAVRKALRLKPLAPRLPFVLYWLDVWFRFAGVNCGFFTISILSLPILVLPNVSRSFLIVRSRVASRASLGSTPKIRGNCKGWQLAAPRATARGPLTQATNPPY